jgi:hypothetical protein
MIKPEQPAGFVESFPRGRQTAEVAARGQPRLFRGHPGVDEALGFECQMGADFIGEVVVGAACPAHGTGLSC